MSKLERGFISTADKTYKRVKGKDGRYYHFKDGTPIAESTFKMVARRHKKREGLNVKIAVPSNKGPGYERKTISNLDMSTLGYNLSVMRNQRNPNAETGLEPDIEEFEIDGETYSLDELYELNQRITERHSADVVFRYT